jgi:hypothetical protein
LEVLATKLKNATEFAVSVLVSWRCPQVYMWLRWLHDKQFT